MLIFKKTTGVKNSGRHNAELVTATSVTGDFKFTKKVADKIGLYAGQVGQLVIGEDAEGKVIVYLAKGRGEALKNEDGSLQRDGRGRIEFSEDMIGSAVSSGTGTALLKMSNTAAWHALEMNGEGSKDFTLGEPVEGAVLIDENGDPEDADNQFVAEFYPLIFKEFRPKSANDKDEDGEETETTDTETTTEPEASEEFDGFEPQEV